MRVYCPELVHFVKVDSPLYGNGVKAIYVCGSDLNKNKETARAKATYKSVAYSKEELEAYSRGGYTMCRFKNPDGICNCKIGKRGTPCICTNPGACTLRQTESEQARSLHKAWARFLSLPVNKQTMYKKLYYGGRYPWEV